MYTVMVTGGLGSGKSELVRQLVAHGAASLDLDAIGHAVLAEDADARRELAERFGADILDDAGEVDRGILARRAFASPEATGALDAVMLERIVARAADYLVDVHCAPVTDAPVQVVEVALLDRVPDFARLADERIAVVAPSDLRLARAIERGMDAQDALARIAAQAADAELERLADTVCDNSGTKAELAAWARRWWDGHVAAGDWSAPASPAPSADKNAPAAAAGDKAHGANANRDRPAASGGRK